MDAMWRLAGSLCVLSFARCRAACPQFLVKQFETQEKFNMPMMFCNEEFDFILNELGYEVSSDCQLFSLQGGVFSYGFGDAGKVTLQHDGSTFPARAELPFGFEIYDNDDGTPVEHGDEDIFLSSVASALRARMPFDESVRVRSPRILPIEVELENAPGIPTIGNSVDISDKNGQTVSALLIGMTLAEDKNLMMCWFALSPEQGKVPTFKSIDRE